MFIVSTQCMFSVFFFKQETDDFEKQIQVLLQQQQEISNEIVEHQTNVQRLQGSSDTLDGDIERLTEVKQKVGYKLEECITRFKDNEWQIREETLWAGNLFSGSWNSDSVPQFRPCPSRYRLFWILEDNLSRDFRYQMSNIEYPYVNNDWLWV